MKTCSIKFLSRIFAATAALTWITTSISGCFPDSSSDNIPSRLLINGASCEFVGGDACLEFYDNVQSSTAETICNEQSLTYSPLVEYVFDEVGDPACPADNQVGYCRATIGTYYYYSGSQWNLAAAQADCLNQGGAFY